MVVCLRQCETVINPECPWLVAGIVPNQTIIDFMSTYTELVVDVNRMLRRSDFHFPCDRIYNFV